MQHRAHKNGMWFKNDEKVLSTFKSWDVVRLHRASQLKPLRELSSLGRRPGLDLDQPTGLLRGEDRGQLLFHVAAARPAVSIEANFEVWKSKAKVWRKGDAITRTVGAGRGA